MSFLSFFEIGFWIVRFIYTILKRRRGPSTESQNKDGVAIVETGKKLFQRRRRIGCYNGEESRIQEIQAGTTDDDAICSINSDAPRTIPETTGNKRERSSVSDWRNNNIKHYRYLNYYRLGVNELTTYKLLFGNLL